MICDFKNLTDAEKRATENILRAVQNKTNAHSYILEGGSARSRLSCAKIIACAAVCRDKKAHLPCLECDQCKKILTDQHTDIKLISPESSGKEIKVDDIRSIRREAYVLPTDCDYHIYIITDSDSMNKSAQNALLKIFEEPPENTIFLLLTHSKDLLLPTVISRAQTHNLGRPNISDSKTTIKEQFPSLSDAAVARAARIQSVFEKLTLDEKTVECFELAYGIAVEYFINENKRITEKLPKSNSELALTLSLLALGARDIAVSKKAKIAPLLFDENQDFQQAKSRCSFKKAMMLYEAFEKAAEKIRAYGNANTTLAELFTCLK